MDLLSAQLKNIRVPCGQDNVYKDECVYSYDTPVSIKYTFIHKSNISFTCKKKINRSKHTALRYYRNTIH